MATPSRADSPEYIAINTAFDDIFGGTRSRPTVRHRVEGVIECEHRSEVFQHPAE